MWIWFFQLFSDLDKFVDFSFLFLRNGLEKQSPWSFPSTKQKIPKIIYFITVSTRQLSLKNESRWASGWKLFIFEFFKITYRVLGFLYIWSLFWRSPFVCTLLFLLFPTQGQNLWSWEFHWAAKCFLIWNRSEWFQFATNTFFPQQSRFQSSSVAQYQVYRFWAVVVNFCPLFPLSLSIRRNLPASNPPCRRARYSPRFWWYFHEMAFEIDFLIRLYSSRSQNLKKMIN